MAPKKGSGKKRAPENESPADRFKRVGTIRLANALSAIDRLSTLRGKNYESNATQRATIKAKLAEAVSRVNAAMDAPEATSKSGPDFSL